MAIAAANNQFDLKAKQQDAESLTETKLIDATPTKPIGSFDDQWRLLRLVAGLPKSAIVKATAKEDASALCRVYSAQCSH